MGVNWTKFTEWLNTGAEPSATLKSEGFKGGYKPPAAVFNYFFNRVGVCISQIQSEVDKCWEKTSNCRKYTERDSNGDIVNTHFTIGNRRSDTPIGANSFANGKGLTASGEYSHAEGNDTTASGKSSCAKGSVTTAFGNFSHAEGLSTQKATNVIPELSESTANDEIIEIWEVSKFSLAKGNNSHAEGTNTLALGYSSHAEGYCTVASGERSHAEGMNTVASKASAHAEGQNAVASGSISHAEGHNTTASGEASHAEGGNTTTTGYGSHAEGQYTTASGKYSHAEGFHTEASGSHQTVVGSYNTTNNYARFIVGCGSEEATANALRVTNDGKCCGNQSFVASGADYAEMFEWNDGNPENEDRRGLFVTLDGEKIKLATPNDNYIVGVVSATPSMLGDTFTEEWHGKFKKDIFGADIWVTVEVEDEVDEEGTVIIPAHTEKRRVLNPDFDPECEYVSRDERKEWAAVGLVGKLIMIDDGTCEVNGYCTVAEGGKATKSENSTPYRVLKRVDETHIKVFIR